MDFSNYVLVRFSLRLNPEWSLKAYGDESGREAWFSMRAQLFKDHLASSLLQQSCPVYRVLVFLDESDRELWDRYLALPIPFMPVFCHGNELNAKTREILSSGRQENIILSRIDSDDAVSYNYLRCVNESVNEAVGAGDSRRYVVASNGFIADARNIQTIHFSCSPFISLFVARYSGEVIYDFNHMKVLDRDPIINKTALWMQIIHGTNVDNRFRRKSVFEPDDPRVMTPGPLLPVESAWPSTFPTLQR